MFVQGPVAGNAAFGIGQEDHHNSGHNWLVHAKFGLIDVSPNLLSKEHRFREPFNGVFNRVWLPAGKDRVSVVLCHDPNDYEAQIEKASHAMAHSTAVYLQLDEQEAIAIYIRTREFWMGSGGSNALMPPSKLAEDGVRVTSPVCAIDLRFIYPCWKFACLTTS